MARIINNLVTIDEATKKRIDDGIEQNRKGDFKLLIVDENNNEIKNAKVHVNQVRHDFKFGANIFMLSGFPDDPKKLDIYIEKFTELFNTATLPLFWRSTETSPGVYRLSKDSENLYRKPTLDLCVEFCKAHNINMRVHGLAYERTFPAWFKDKDDEWVKDAFEKHTKIISDRYKDDIESIEVTNEMYWEEKSCHFASDPDFVSFCFKTARKYFPNNNLIMNETLRYIYDFKNRATAMPFFDQVKRELENGTSIDEINTHYHMFFFEDKYYEEAPLFYDLPKFMEILDKYQTLGVPFGISEITIPCFSSEAKREEEQADIVEQLYSLWFSHPNMSQISYWNVVDGYTAFTGPGDMKTGENLYYGGLLRFDMSEKPAFKRLRYLLKEKWHTELDVETNNSGEACFRGFYGDYKVNVNGKDYVVTLNKNTREAKCVIK